jgi:geranylgeranylglycerol-phosphate geranylgeranyltransferase
MVGDTTMSVSTVTAALKLSRPPSCTLAFLTVFLPTYTHTQSISGSFAVSLPVFVICMCTFILNDIHDIHRDRINHPDRPLPSGDISPRSASIIYMSACGVALLLIGFFTDPYLHYIYLSAFVLAINYNVVVDTAPKLKTFYVASLILLCLILVGRIVGSPVNTKLLIAAFLFVLGRELLMDIQDIRGDGNTLVKHVGPTTATCLAFCMQAAAVGILAFAVRTPEEAISVSVAGLLLSIIIYGWRKEHRRPELLRLMHLQMLAGVAFLG